MTVLLEPLFDAKLPRPFALVQGAAVAFGVWIVAGAVEIRAGLGVSLALCSALLLALRNIILRRFLLSYSGLTVILYQTVVTALIFAGDVVASAPRIDSLFGALVLRELPPVHVWVGGAIIVAAPIASSLRARLTTRM
jgi:drug/metabolite transporter (DMT)-like permease